MGGDALGWCEHCTRIGMDSYQHPSVAYGSGRKNPKSAQHDPREHRPRGERAGGRPAVKNAMGDALGSCAHCTRIGMDSYERPIVGGL